MLEPEKQERKRTTNNQTDKYRWFDRMRSDTGVIYYYAQGKSLCALRSATNGIPPSCVSQPCWSRTGWLQHQVCSLLLLSSLSVCQSLCLFLRCLARPGSKCRLVEPVTVDHSGLIRHCQGRSGERTRKERTGRSLQLSARPFTVHSRLLNA
jgi:hypothetical protein